MAEEEKLLKDAKELPWKDRLMHENWKVRREANIDLGLSALSRNPRNWAYTSSGLRLRIVDTVGERFECIGTGGSSRCPYCALNHVDAGEARRYAPEICDAIFANCFVGGLDMIQKSQELCMRWVELEAVEVFLKPVMQLFQLFQQ